MNTKSVYNKIKESYGEEWIIPWSELCMRFSLAVIELNATLDDCEHCPFQTYKNKHCYLSCVEKESGKSICTTYDFIKYTLREI